MTEDWHTPPRPQTNDTRKAQTVSTPGARVVPRDYLHPGTVVRIEGDLIDVHHDGDPDYRTVTFVPSQLELEADVAMRIRGILARHPDE